MERKPAARRSLALLAVLAITAGCTLGEALQDPGEHVDMTPATLVGTWHAGGVRWLDFAEDGTFTATNLPVERFREYRPAAGDSLDGSGLWSLEGLPGDPSAAPHAIVHLRFQRLGGAAVGYGGPDLTALRPADGKVYLVFISEATTVGYLRCETDCPSSTPPAPVPSAS